MEESEKSQKNELEVICRLGSRSFRVGRTESLSKDLWEMGPKGQVGPGPVWPWLAAQGAWKFPPTQTRIAGDQMRERREKSYKLICSWSAAWAGYHRYQAWGHLAKGTGYPKAHH